MGISLASYTNLIAIRVPKYLEGNSMPSVIGAWRSRGKDPSVLKQMVKPGTVKKTLLFALPYTRLLVLFLLAVIVDATIGMANPLLYRQIINNGILKGNSELIIHLALIVAILGIFDGALGTTQTYLASKTGAGRGFQ